MTPGDSNVPGSSANLRQSSAPLRVGTLAGQTPAPLVTSAKPFSDYHTPAPISPYLYMYGPSRGAGVEQLQSHCPADAGAAGRRQSTLADCTGEPANDEFQPNAAVARDPTIEAPI